VGSHLRRMLRPLVTTVVVAASLAACQQRTEATTDREMDWARAALERNPAIELVSADAEARRFTVRIKASGELATVPLGTLVAGPVESFAAPQPPTAAPEEPPVALAQPPAAEAVDEVAETVPAASPEPEEPAAGTEAVAPAYTVQRSASGVRVTGPGVSIETVGPPAGAAAAAASPGMMRADSAIICEGARLLQIDGRNLAVAGDAIVARDGCEIHITNSRIDASRSAVTVQNARVHITNSQVKGSFRSLDIDDGGQVYARSSEFTGLVQRRGSAKLEDLGGNVFN